MMASFPKKLSEITGFLQRSPVSLTNAHRDGRINSAHHEDQIVEHLRNNGFDKNYFSTSEDLDLSNRCWFDILVKDGDRVHPVNIKTSSHKSADNACNFLALNWALTDIDIEFSATPHAGRDTRNFVSWAQGNRGYSERDYYFISVNKNNTEEVILNSIKRMPEVSSNPNNLPFQVCWENNKHSIERTNKEAVEYYMSILKESFEKDWRMNLAEYLLE
tara:strand:- start:165 stop:818 length:654 start_codon:yes stop_codon:yes gene_type:complete